MWDTDCRNDLRSPDGYTVPGTDSISYQGAGWLQRCQPLRTGLLRRRNSEGVTNREMVEKFGYTWRVQTRDILSMNCLDHNDVHIADDPVEDDLETDIAVAEAKECCKRYGAHSSAIDNCATDLIGIDSSFPQHVSESALNCSSVFDIPDEDDRWLTTLCAEECNDHHSEEAPPTVPKPCRTKHASSGEPGVSWALSTECIDED